MAQHVGAVGGGPASPPGGRSPPATAISPTPTAELAAVVAGAHAAATEAIRRLEAISAEIEAAVAAAGRRTTPAEGREFARFLLDKHREIVDDRHRPPGPTPTPKSSALEQLQTATGNVHNAAARVNCRARPAEYSHRHERPPVASYQDLLDAIARVGAATGDPDAWMAGLSGADLAVVTTPVSVVRPPSTRCWPRFGPHPQVFAPSTARTSEARRWPRGRPPTRSEPPKPHWPSRTR